MIGRPLMELEKVVFHKPKTVVKCHFYIGAAMFESKKGVPGIYAIVNLKDGKRYVGSAVCLGTRARAHENQLAGNRHFNRRLQGAWNRDGADSFRFDVIEVVGSTSELIAAEQRHIDAAAANRYNLRPKAESNLGIRWSDEFKAKISAGLTGKVHSEETKRRMSASHKGKIRSAEHTEKIIATKRGVPRPAHVIKASSDFLRKFTDAQVIEIRALRALGKTYRVIAEQYNCSQSTILFVVKGKGVCYSG